MKPKYTTSKLCNSFSQAPLITVITLCMSGSAFAADVFWNGSVSNDWNTAGNWTPGLPTAPDDAVVNNAGAFPTAVISANLTVNPRDIIVGRGTGNTGQLDLTAGNITTGGWTFIGRNTGSTGTFNINNPGGSYSTGRLVVGEDGTGNLNFGGGTINSNAEVWIGQGGTGNGTMTMTAGTLNSSNWTVVGRAGSQGLLNMSGGTINKTGGGQYINGDNGVATVNQSNGSVINSNNEFWVGQAGGATGSVYTLSGPSVGAGATQINSTGTFIVGREGGSNITMNQTGGAVTIANGELQVGQNGSSNGTYNLSSGNLTVNNWAAIGRDSGTGRLNVSGGTVTKNGGGHLTIGTLGTNSNGRVDVTNNGTILMNSGNLLVGEGGTTSTGQLDISGNGLVDLSNGALVVAVGTSTTGTANLMGGTLRTQRISSGSVAGLGVGDSAAAGNVSTINFTGTQIIATATTADFISQIDTATLGAGNLNLNTGTFAIGVPQLLGGTGGVIKTGSGTLTLTGASTYSGVTAVNTGKLIISTTTANSGAVTVADNATFGVVQATATGVVTRSNVTFGSAGPTSLDFNLGNFAGNPTSAPLNVTGTLALNGTVTINIADGLPAIGNIPLVSYVGPISVAANFVLGTLPNGVVATLDKTSTPGLVFLNVTSASLLVWKGNVDGVWNFTTPNWSDLVTGGNIYADGAPVLFNDTATGTTLVTLGLTVAPSKVTYNNSLLGYFLTGAGKISGSASLLKQGTASLTISTPNDYTGTTTLEGGATSVNLLANGGSPSSIGASTASASNLVLSGGTLNYTGPNVTINRGFTISAANSTFSTVNSLNMSGPVVTTIGYLVKAGGGSLTLSNPGANTLGSSGQNVRVNGGTLTLDGSGTQTLSVPGELWTGAVQDVTADLVLNNTSLTVGSWIAMGRGNGTTGTVTKLTATNSTIQNTNVSTGFDAGIAFNDSDQIILLTGSTWTNSGRTALAESLNSTTTMTLAGASSFSSADRTELALGAGSVVNMTIGGTSSYVANRFTMAFAAGSSANVTVQDSGSLTKIGGWLSIGNSNNGVGVMTVKNSGTVFADGDFNVSDVDTSTGTLNIQNSALVTSTGNGVYIAKNDGTTGTVNLDGGRLIAKGVYGNGSTGVGTFNFNGGVLEAGTGVNPVFMSGIDNVIIKSGGATIDTGVNTAAINQLISEDATGRTLNKLGTGTLLLNSFNTYTGTTSVAAGTLGGTGAVGGAVLIGAAGNINPGVTTGTLYVDSLAFTAGGKLTIDLAAAADTVAVTNGLNLTNSTLVLNGTPSLSVYILASYGAGLLTGTFPGAAPTGYVFDYDYLGNSQVALVRVATPYDTWISTFFPGETDPAIIGKLADPDSDGSANITEFALGGVPNDGSNNPKVYSIIGDSSDAGVANELLMTIAVRTATPVFAGSPSPSASLDGIDIRVQGSLDLGTFTSPTSVVTPVITGIPPVPPTGYEYRTFSLDASEGVPNSGFLRVQVVGTP